MTLNYMLFIWRGNLTEPWIFFPASILTAPGFLGALGVACAWTILPLTSWRLAFSSINSLFHVLRADQLLKWVWFIVPCYVPFSSLHDCLTFCLLWSLFLKLLESLSLQYSVYSLTSCGYFSLVQDHSVQGKASVYPFSSHFQIHTIVLSVHLKKCYI